MNQVQQLRQHFEKLKVPNRSLIELEKLPKTQTPPVKAASSPFIGLFKRSKTSIEITRKCDNTAEADKDLLNKCLKRSPAFRYNQDRTRASIHSHPSAKSVEKRVRTFETMSDEVQYLASSETIKKALSKPLPVGRPPPKPPRVFASNENGRKSSTSSCSSSSTPNRDEVIYAQPFVHSKQPPKPQIETEELHYMCTDLDTGRSQISKRRSSLQAAHESIEKSSIEKVRRLLLPISSQLTTGLRVNFLNFFFFLLATFSHSVLDRLAVRRNL